MTLVVAIVADVALAEDVEADVEIKRLMSKGVLSPYC